MLKPMPSIIKKHKANHLNFILKDKTIKTPNDSAVPNHAARLYEKNKAIKKIKPNDNDRYFCCRVISFLKEKPITTGIINDRIAP